MVTISPALAPFFTGDVVILVPVRKFFELLTIPVIDPSGFCVKLLTTGTSLATAGLGLDPNREKVGLFCAGLAGGAVSAFGVTFFGAPPKENPPDFFTGVGAAGAAGSSFLGGCDPNKLNVGDF